jgi:hypothetical protein
MTQRSEAQLAAARGASTKRSAIFLASLGAAIALTGCAESATKPDPVPMAPTSARHDLNPASGVRSFRFTGFSYGPNYEERPPGGCAGLYQTRTDSVLIRRTAPVWYGRTSSIEKVGCGISSDPGGGSYDGGRISLTIATTDLIDWGVEADGTEFLWLDEIPRDGTLHLEALPQGGFVFLDWIITRADNSVYRDYNQVLDRSTNTNDVEFKAEFLSQ